MQYTNRLAPLWKIRACVTLQCYFNAHRYYTTIPPAFTKQISRRCSTQVASPLILNPHACMWRSADLMRAFILTIKPQHNGSALLLARAY